MSDQIEIGMNEVQIGADGDMVKITFPKPIEWMTMPKESAVNFAIAILHQCGVAVQTTLVPQAPPPPPPPERAPV